MNGRFSQALREKKRSGVIPVIPDFKRISPKEGELFAGRDPVAMAKLLEGLGAPALSVVTEGDSFGGSMALLESIIRATGLPVLRKDFIKSEDDLKATRDAGADAVLLICATMDARMLTHLYEQALLVGLEPLVEARDAQELALAGTLGAKLVGINNRDILRLEKDGGTVSRTAQLTGNAPEGATLVSESGICSPFDARAAMDAGADAVLVGTAIWHAKGTKGFYLSLCKGRHDAGGKRDGTRRAGGQNMRP